MDVHAFRSRSVGVSFTAIQAIFFTGKCKRIKPIALVFSVLYHVRKKFRTNLNMDIVLCEHKKNLPGF